MSIFTKIAVATGMAGVVRRSGAAATVTTVGAAPGSQAVNRYGRFQDIVDALRQALTRLAQEELQGYQAIDPSLRCGVIRIEMRPSDAANAQTLNELLARINAPAVIAGFIQRDLLSNLPMGRSFDFSRFEKLAPLSSQARTDDAGAAHDAIAAEDMALMREFESEDSPAGMDGHYEVGIHWEAVRDSGESAATSDVWQVEDAQGTRAVHLVRRDAAHKLILGSGEGVDIRVGGRFTSSRHAALWYERGTWWYEDLQSSNGSRIVAMGRDEQVFPPRASVAAAVPAVEVRPGCAIFLAAHSTGPRADFPKLMLPSGGQPAHAERGRPVTPVASAASAAAGDPPAPRAPAVAGAYAWERPPDALLQIQDNAGNRQVPVHGVLLPFVIGRDPQADCIVTGSDATVSARHIEIYAIDASGVLLRVVGLNGAVLGDKLFAQGSQTLWKWHESLLIGGAGETQCRLTVVLPMGQ